MEKHYSDKRRVKTYKFEPKIEVINMTEKRFENRLNKDNIKFNTLNPVWDNEKETAWNVFEMIDLMNELATKCSQLKNENEQLKSELAEIKRQDREVLEYLQAYHKGDVNELKKELSK